MRREKLYAFAVAPLLLLAAAGCGEVTDAPERLELPGSLEFSSVAVKKTPPMLSLPDDSQS